MGKIKSPPSMSNIDVLEYQNPHYIQEKGKHFKDYTVWANVCNFTESWGFMIIEEDESGLYAGCLWRWDDKKSDYRQEEKKTSVNYMDILEMEMECSLSYLVSIQRERSIREWVAIIDIISNMPDKNDRIVCFQLYSYIPEEAHAMYTSWKKEMMSLNLENSSPEMDHTGEYVINQASKAKTDKLFPAKEEERPKTFLFSEMRAEAYMITSPELSEDHMALGLDDEDRVIKVFSDLPTDMGYGEYNIVVYEYPSMDMGFLVVAGILDSYEQRECATHTELLGYFQELKDTYNIEFDGGLKFSLIQDKSKPKSKPAATVVNKRTQDDYDYDKWHKQRNVQNGRGIPSLEEAYEQEYGMAMGYTESMGFRRHISHYSTEEENFVIKFEGDITDMTDKSIAQEAVEKLAEGIDPEDLSFQTVILEKTDEFDRIVHRPPLKEDKK